MDDGELKRGLRNAWILTLVAVVFVVVFFVFTLRANRPATPESWEMGGTPFVPASHPAAEGYYRPVPPEGGKR